MKTALLDVDGVIRNWVVSVETFYALEFPQKRIIKPFLQWDVSVNFPDHSPSDFWTWVYNSPSSYDMSYYAPEYPFVAKIIKKLNQHCKVSICTYQPSQACKAATLEWLELRDIAYSDIIFAKEKWNYQGILIDDALHNVEKHLEMHGPNSAILMDQPWNSISSNHDIENCRVKTLDEALVKIKSL